MNNRSLLLALLMVGSLARSASAETISNVFSFGDSLTDTGNIMGADQRYTNEGNMWIEDFNHKLGLSAIPARKIDPNTGAVTPNGGNNYAVGGASIAATPNSVTLTDEVAAFEADHTQISRHDMVIIWAGAGDAAQSIVDPTWFNVGSITTDYINNIKELQKIGAKNIVSILTPSQYVGYFGSFTGNKISYKTNLTNLNASLKPALTDAGVYMINADKLTTDVNTRLAHYGFTIGDTGEMCPTFPCTLPNDGHVYANGPHFSSAMDAVIADYVFAQLRARDQFVNVLTSPSVEMRQNALSLEQRLDRTAFLRSDAQGQMLERTTGNWQTYAQAQANGSGKASSGGTDTRLTTTGGGGSVGADVVVMPGVLVGGQFFYGGSSGSFGNNTGGFTRTSAVGTAYGMLKLTDNAYLNASATYGSLDYGKIMRQTALGSTAFEQAFGKTTGDYESARIGGGYHFAIGQFFNVTPNMALTYERTGVRGYQEQNSVLGLAYGDSSYDSLRGSLGVNTSFTNLGAFHPYANLRIDRDLPTNDVTVKVGPDRLSLVNYTTARPQQTVGSLLVGTQYQISDTVSLDAKIGADQAFGKGEGGDVFLNLGVGFTF